MVLQEWLISRNNFEKQIKSLNTIIGKLAQEIAIEFVSAYENKICNAPIITGGNNNDIVLLSHLSNALYDIQICDNDISKAIITIAIDFANRYDPCDNYHYYNSIPIDIAVLTDKEKRQSFIKTYKIKQNNL